MSKSELEGFSAPVPQQYEHMQYTKITALSLTDNWVKKGEEGRGWIQLVNQSTAY